MTGCNLLDFGKPARQNGKRLPCERLMDENAKLREMCKEWYRYARELFDEFIGEPELSEDFMALEDRLREIGVEPY